MLVKRFNLLGCVAPGGFDNETNPAVVIVHKHIGIFDPMSGFFARILARPTACQVGVGL